MALNINEQSLIRNFVNLGISLNAKKNATIVENGSDNGIGKQIAMHVAAANPASFP